MKARHVLPLFLTALALHGQAQSVYTVDPLDIRPAGEDFAPVLVDGSLVITSIRTRAQAIAYTGAGSGKPLADLYRIALRDGKPGHPQLLDGTLCSKYNDGPATFSSSGDTICFTRNGGGGKRKAADRLDLFFAVKQGREWSEPVPFAYNIDGFSTMSASLSPDGQLLYFASDRPGGMGGMDLYVSRRQGASWSAPENLGASVNTAANEAYPTVQPNGTLYFSSNRPGGPGKLDIYACSLEAGEAARPLLLPAPLNSPGNDLSFTAHADGGHGFFSSDRDGSDRIYRFTRAPEPFHDCTEQQPVSYCFHFEDAGSTNTDTLPLRYEWDFGDGSKVAAPVADHCFAKTGTYTVNLNLIDMVSESVYFNQVSYELEVADDEQAYINTLDSAGTGQLLRLDTRHTNLPGFTPKEIHWDLGDSTTAGGDSILHAYAQAGTYTIKLDLIGGPDGQGGYIHHCVTRRMRVIDGIEVPSGPAPATAVAASPKGESGGFTYEALPADAFSLSNQAAADVSYTVQLLASADRLSPGDARFLPIRPYYAITERFVPKDRLYSYSIGSGSSPLSVFGAFQLARRAGFTGSEVKGVHADKDLDLAQAEALPLESLNNGVLRFSSIHFKTGESGYDATFNKSLDRILALLRKYPAVDLAIEAHTDAVGTSESNLALSRARAQAIMDHFIRKGVAADRLSPVGYGEERPVAGNGSAKGRAENRRVEFRISVRDTTEPPRP